MTTPASLIQARLIQATLKAVKISENPKGLFLEWSDGFNGVVPFATLRRECPCAACKGERLPFDLEPAPLPVYQPLSSEAGTLKEMFRVGNYAIGFRWGDGHDSGIYTFEYLRTLAANRSTTIDQQA